MCKLSQVRPYYDRGGITIAGDESCNHRTGLRIALVKMAFRLFSGMEVDEIAMMVQTVMELTRIELERAADE